MLLGTLSASNIVSKNQSSPPSGGEDFCVVPFIRNKYENFSRKGLKTGGKYGTINRIF